MLGALEPVASAWRFFSENNTEFSLRAPVIACAALTRGLGGADATTPRPSASNGLSAALLLATNRFERAAAGCATEGDANNADVGPSSANGSAPIDGCAAELRPILCLCGGDGSDEAYNEKNTGKSFHYVSPCECPVILRLRGEKRKVRDG